MSEAVNLITEYKLESETIAEYIIRLIKAYHFDEADSDSIKAVLETRTERLILRPDMLYVDNKGNTWISWYDVEGRLGVTTIVSVRTSEEHPRVLVKGVDRTFPAGLREARVIPT